jgi:hypothetical protein
MSGNEKKTAIQKGLTIAGQHLFGDVNKDRRERLKKAGAVYDSKGNTWVCPNEQVYQAFTVELKIGQPVVAAPPPGAKPVQPALPQPASPPPASLPVVKLVPKPAEPQPAAVPAAQPVEAQPQEPQGLALVQGKKILQIPPSYIVVQEVKVQGDIRYTHLDEENSSSEDSDGTKVAKTKRTTETVIKDPEEFQRARYMAGQLRGSVRKLGQVLQSGVILVPVAKEKELDEAISTSRTEATSFNREAKHHFVRVSMLKSLITTDAEAAARDIAWKLQETMAELKTALEQCDVERIKSITDNAKTLTRIIPAREANQLSAALANANATRKYIQDELKKKGKQIEDVQAEVRRTSLGPVESARMMFLEYAAPVEMEYAGATDVERFAEMDSQEPQAATSAVAVNGDRFDL